MHVTHLYHSGFLVELSGCSLLFDWYPTSNEKARADLSLIDPTKKLYGFVSHAHHDHYLKSIWDLARALPRADPTFIVDEAVAADAPHGRDLDVVACEPEQIYEIDEDVEVTTLASTDEGLAFCVDVGGKTIYHAGDLSVWWWPNRDEADNIRSESNCRHYLEVLENRHIDLAFLPITPRAGVDGDRGIELFMRRVGADVVVPMHYLDSREAAISLALGDRLSPWHDRICFDESFDL